MVDGHGIHYLNTLDCDNSYFNNNVIRDSYIRGIALENV